MVPRAARMMDCCFSHEKGKNPIVVRPGSGREAPSREGRSETQGGGEGIFRDGRNEAAVQREHGGRGYDDDGRASSTGDQVGMDEIGCERERGDDERTVRW